MERIIIFIASLFAFIACQKEIPFSDLDLVIEPEIVLSASVYNGYFGASIHYSKSTADAGNLMHIDNAEFFLYKDGNYLNDVVLQKEFQYNFVGISGDSIIYDSIPSRCYFSTNLSDITVESNYLLKLFIPGYDTVYAKTYLPKTIGIRLVESEFLNRTFAENRYLLTFEVDDPPNENNFYKFNLGQAINLYIEGTVGFWYEGAKYDNVSQYTFSDKELNDNKFNVEFIESYQAGRVSRVPYEFCQKDSSSFFSEKTSSYQSDMNASNNFYAFEPINVYSNVVNGYGTFHGTGTAFTDTIDLLALFPEK